MKYRTKIYLSFIIVTTLSVLLGVSFLYTKASETLKFELRTKVVSVAATAAALIDPKDVKIVSETLDPNTQAFATLQKQLIYARDNNRRPDLFVKYVYLLRPESSGSKQIIFLIEAQNAVTPGEKDDQQSQSKIFNHLQEFYSPNRFIRDKYGIWMSGFAPIVDEDGNYIATVGVDISAKSVDQTLNQMLVDSFIALCIAILIAYSIAYYIAHKLTDALDMINFAIDQVATGDYQVTLDIEQGDEFGKLGTAINGMVKGLKERQTLKSSFSRYVSGYVMDQLLSETPNLNLLGERKKITVLFSDIRHFTQISEKMSPESVVALLNEYFDAMLKVVFKHYGTIDKFIGDGLMVEFGAPLPDFEQESHACRCAIEMQRELQVLNERFIKEGRPVLQIGIGIHTGYAIVGNIGTETRMEYTAIGDCVNVASRLEQATKTYGTSIILSEDTFEALGPDFSGKSIGTVTLPGREKEINIFSLDF